MRPMNATEHNRGENSDIPRPEWRIAGVSVAGSSHVRSGVKCQDSHGWFVVGSLTAIAVADGAGSAPLSHVGSAVAVRSALSSLLAQYQAGTNFRDGELAPSLRTSMFMASMALDEAAESFGTKPRELATTLLLVVAGSDFVGAAQIGDGAVVAGDSELNVLALTMPSSGEHLNETTFLTSPDSVETAQITIRQLKLAHLAIFSDGLQMLGLKMPAASPHAPFFIPLFKYLAATPEDKAREEVKRFLKGPRVAERTDDDLTLVLAHLFIA